MRVVDQTVQPLFRKRKRRKQGSVDSQLTEDNGALESSNERKRRKGQSEQSAHAEGRGETEGKTRQYVQGVLADGQRICATCTKSFQPVVVPGCSELPYGGRFCSRACYKVFLVR